MTLEITRLLEISPDSSLPEIRKAYHKRRREIDPDMTWQLEKLDTAYEPALIWFRQHPHDDPTSARSPHSEHLNPERPAQQRMPVNATCSELQRQAMELLGAAPGCDLKAAAGIARRKGVPEDDILRACELISTMPGSSGALHLPVQALWKVLAALPALIAFGLYNLLFGSGVDFFPGHSYPEMARWFSGTLLASSAPAAVYTTAVPLLLLLIAEMVFLAAACAINQNLPSVLNGLKFDTAQQSVMMSVVTAVLAIGKIAQGVLYQKTGARVGGGITIAIFALGLVLLSTRETAMFALPFCAIGLGVYTTLMPIVTRRVVGAEQFAATWGILQAIASVSIAVAIPLWGLVFDICGSYAPVLIAHAVLLAISLAANFLLTRPVKD